MPTDTTELQRNRALSACLSAMLRMIPGYLADTGAEHCTDEQANNAIADAAFVLYGADMSAWPAGVAKAASGGYDE